MFGLENSVVDSLMIRSENHLGLSTIESLVGILGILSFKGWVGPGLPKSTLVDLGQWTELTLWTLTSVTICVCLFIAIFFKILNMVLEYRKKKSNRPDEIVYLVSSSNRPRASRIDEGRGFDIQSVHKIF